MLFRSLPTLTGSAVQCWGSARVTKPLCGILCPSCGAGPAPANHACPSSSRSFDPPSADEGQDALLPFRQRGVARIGVSVMSQAVSLPAPDAISLPAPERSACPPHSGQFARPEAWSVCPPRDRSLTAPHDTLAPILVFPLLAIDNRARAAQPARSVSGLEHVKSLLMLRFSRPWVRGAMAEASSARPWPPYLCFLYSPSTTGRERLNRHAR